MVANERFEGREDALLETGEATLRESISNVERALETGEGFEPSVRPFLVAWLERARIVLAKSEQAREGGAS